MDNQLLASLVGSAHYGAVRDDSLKDEDNAAWVMELPGAERAEWVERIRWIRLVDRLAEKEQIGAIARDPAADTTDTIDNTAHRSDHHSARGNTATGSDNAKGDIKDNAKGKAKGRNRGTGQDGGEGDDSHSFAHFCQAWQRLKGLSRNGDRPPWKGVIGEIDCSLEAPLDSILQAIAQRWFQSPQRPMASLSIQAWDRYISAIDLYHRQPARIRTLEDYETMLDGLAGSFFQILPYLQPQHWDCARHFGIVDQFYNNLRDIHEDAQRGICYFPTEVLERYGVSRESVLDGSCIGTANYQQLMEFWVGDYLLKLRRQAHGLLLCPDLHPSWLRLRAWCLRRYERIEQVMRQCQFDFVLFSQCYWQVVQDDLQQYHQLQNQAQRFPAEAYLSDTQLSGEPTQFWDLSSSGAMAEGTAGPTAAASLALARVGTQEPVTWCWAIAHFLKLSPAVVALSQRLFIRLNQSQFVARPFPPAHGDPQEIMSSPPVPTLTVNPAPQSPSPSLTQPIQSTTPSTQLTNKPTNKPTKSTKALRNSPWWTLKIAKGTPDIVARIAPWSRRSPKGGSPAVLPG